MRFILPAVLCAILVWGFSATAIAKPGSEKQYHKKLEQLKDGDATGHYGLGKWCEKNSMPERARKHFEKSIELEPNHAGARKKLGFIKYKGRWIRKGDKGRVDFEEKRARLKEDDSDGFYRLGLWCRKKKLETEAVEMFEKVISLDPNHKKARKQLGFVDHKGEWMTKEEKEETIARERGLVRYGNRWLKPAEMEALRAKERAAIGWNFENKVQTSHYVIYSAAGLNEAKHIGKVAESLYKTYTKFFSKFFRFSTGHQPLKVKLYASRKEFKAAAKGVVSAWAEGFYDGKFSHQYYDSKAENPYHWFLHEGTHQLKREVARLNIPQWIDEGLACYFGASKVEDGKLTRGKIDNNAYPVWFVSRYVTQNNFMPLRTVVEGKGGPDKDKHFNLYYVQWWSLTHFLFHHDDAKYAKGYLEVIKRGGGVRAFEQHIGKFDEINKEWLEYIKSLAAQK